MKNVPALLNSAGTFESQAGVGEEKILRQNAPRTPALLRAAIYTYMLFVNDKQQVIFEICLVGKKCWFCWCIVRSRPSPLCYTCTSTIFLLVHLLVHLPVCWCILLPNH